MAVLSPPDLGASVGLTFPTMYAGQRVYAREEVPQLPVADIPARVGEELRELRLRPGARVAITAGSRGVANIPIILKACGDAIRAAGGEPFITPAMGSHGGATAEGQTAVLAGYGVTPETVGMPVVSSMEVRQIGMLDGEMPVFMSTVALDADHVLLVNRVKPHTDFRGPIESGLSKICAIGLGKQRGAQTIHSYGTRGLADLMPRAARCMIDTTGKVLGGLAILENAYDETAAVQWLAADAVGREPEMGLLERGAKLMAGLPFDQIDVLVIDEMGKNISGAGMDTNVIGRMFVPGVTEFDATEDHRDRGARPDRAEPWQRDWRRPGRLHHRAAGVADRLAGDVHERLYVGHRWADAQPPAERDAGRSRGGRGRDPHVRQAGPEHGARGAHQEHAAGGEGSAEREHAGRRGGGKGRDHRHAGADELRPGRPDQLKRARTTPRGSFRMTTSAPGVSQWVWTRLPSST